MRFQNARDLAFKEFMNKFQSMPQYIALYLDHQQTEGFRRHSNLSEINKEIDAVIKLFCCLDNRDLFIETYSILFAERLLNKKSCNDEAEESVIKQLQVECGHHTVSKIRTMYADISKSKDISKEFEQAQPTRTNSVQGVELNNQILTMSQWPF